MPHDAELHAPPEVSPLGVAARERRDAAEHRQQVLLTAARLFAERGVAAVTMDEIARAAGVGKGTLYRRYADKGTLCLALMDACVRHLQEEVSAELARGVATASPLKQLNAFLGRLLAFIEDHAEWLGVISDEAKGQRRGQFYRSPLYGWMHGVVVDLLERAVAEGEAEVDDCVYTADALLAAVDVDLYLFQRRERGRSAEHVLAGLRCLVEGLRVGPR